MKRSSSRLSFVSLAIRLPFLSVLSAVLLLGAGFTQASAAPVLSQDFNTSVTTGGWTVSNAVGGGAVTWALNTAGSEQNWTGGTGSAAMADSFTVAAPGTAATVCRQCHSSRSGPIPSSHQAVTIPVTVGRAYDTALVSPAVTLPQVGAGQNLQLSFRMIFQPWSNDEKAAVDVSTNGGSTWTTLTSWTGPATAVEGPQTLSLNSYAGLSVKLRFRYSNTQSYARDVYWQIDDVVVDLVSGPLPVPGDFNRDGSVTGADYVLWGNTYGNDGSPGKTDLRADGNGDGVVSGADYVVWANNFGRTSP